MLLLSVKLICSTRNFFFSFLDVWNWVMAWQDMIPEPCMVTLLEKNFFPKWLQVLYTWLTHSPNYEEVTKWYTGWKSMLPASLLAHPIIKGRCLKFVFWGSRLCLESEIFLLIVEKSTQTLVLNGNNKNFV